jgi:orotate phosphoribosyltransferase-like protein
VVEVAIVDNIDPPVYLRIASKARHLRELGMSDRQIAQRLSVSDKTATKAANVRSMQMPPRR